MLDLAMIKNVKDVKWLEQTPSGLRGVGLTDYESISPK
ncbi:hypothetical protein BN8_p06759 (plasmid) [Fibrisoma limi BUZ 3]|uniref:Uncharacterized protein n=1 Tax=Fibrisoma limi BUZ 3 TaxID=1185876 RepID=I2GTX1_9BACT|nr:hypothetical protein BN8_p06759 [Fibrisoma limi BUZ 3]